MTKVISVINQKGGVGKSTTAHTLGFGLVKRGYKVLLIDLDAQTNLSFIMDVDGEHNSIFEVLMDECGIKEAIQRTEGADLVIASNKLSGADMFLSMTGKEFKLKEAIDAVRDEYDFVVIDTPPALGILTVNALTASDDAIIPAGADILSLQGIGQLYGTIEAVKRYTNPKLNISGILLTRYNGRTVLGRDVTEMMEETAESLSTKVYDTKIREAVVIKEAQISREDIFSYAPQSNVASDYDEFIEEYLRDNK